MNIERMAKFLQWLDLKHNNDINKLYDEFKHSEYFV